MDLGVAAEIQLGQTVIVAVQDTQLGKNTQIHIPAVAADVQMIDQRIVVQVHRGDAAVATAEGAQLGILGYIDSGDLGVAAVQICQVGQHRHIQCGDGVLVHIDELQIRAYAQINGGDLVHTGLQNAQVGIAAEIQLGQMVLGAPQVDEVGEVLDAFHRVDIPPLTGNGLDAGSFLTGQPAVLDAVHIAVAAVFQNVVAEVLVREVMLTDVEQISGGVGTGGDEGICLTGQVGILVAAVANRLKMDVCPIGVSGNFIFDHSDQILPGGIAFREEYSQIALDANEDHITGRSNALEAYFLQIGVTGKQSEAVVGDTCGEGQCGQAGTACEGSIAAGTDGGHTLRDGDVGELAALIEGDGSDGINTVGNGEAAGVTTGAAQQGSQILVIKDTVHACVVGVVLIHIDLGKQIAVGAVGIAHQYPLCAEGAGGKVGDAGGDVDLSDACSAEGQNLDGFHGIGDDDLRDALTQSKGRPGDGGNAGRNGVAAGVAGGAAQQSLHILGEQDTVNTGVGSVGRIYHISGHLAAVQIVPADVGHILTEVHSGQLRIAVQCFVVDIGDAVLDHKGLHQILVGIPVDGMIHLTGTGNGQGAVTYQFPGDGAAFVGAGDGEGDVVGAPGDASAEVLHNLLGPGGVVGRIVGVAFGAAEHFAVIVGSIAVEGDLQVVAAVGKGQPADRLNTCGDVHSGQAGTTLECRPINALQVLRQSDAGQRTAVHKRSVADIYHIGGQHHTCQTGAIIKRFGINEADIVGNVDAL